VPVRSGPALGDRVAAGRPGRNPVAGAQGGVAPYSRSVPAVAG